MLICFTNSLWSRNWRSFNKSFFRSNTDFIYFILKLGHLKKDIKTEDYKKKIKELRNLPKLVEQTLLVDSEIQTISSTFNEAKGSMFLGRGFSYPIALEGALKLKELSYVHAEGYPAGEMKHGPLALIEEGMPVVVFGT